MSHLRTEQVDSLSYFHGFLIVMAEEIVGLVSSHSLSTVDAQVKHCEMNRRTLTLLSHPHCVWLRSSVRLCL